MTGWWYLVSRACLGWPWCRFNFRRLDYVKISWSLTVSGDVIGLHIYALVFLFLRRICRAFRQVLSFTDRIYSVGVKTPQHTYTPDQNVYHARTHFREKGYSFNVRSEIKKNGSFCRQESAKFSKRVKFGMYLLPFVCSACLNSYAEMYFSFNYDLEVMKNTTYIEKCLQFNAVTYIRTFTKRVQ